jgi:hypothetical protein
VHDNTLEPWQKQAQESVRTMMLSKTRRRRREGERERGREGDVEKINRWIDGWMDG